MTWEPEDRAIVAQRAMHRALAITKPCAYCGARVGDNCVHIITGAPLVHMPAHLIRLQEVGL